MYFDLETLGDETLYAVKSANFFPFKSGKLFKSCKGRMVKPDTYRIHFDRRTAPYVEYLEEGTKEHDIPFAFVGKGNWVWWYPYKDGVPFLMGMGGRFNGKFHPGSTKHKGFIKNKFVIGVASYIAIELDGRLEQI